MSLAHAVEEVAKQIEETNIDEMCKYSIKKCLQDYAALLRLVIKASSGEQNPITIPHEDPTIKNTVRLQEEMKRARQEETAGSSMRELVGGFAGDVPTSVPVTNKMPVGAKMLVCDQVFVLQTDHRLHYSEEETNKLRVQRKGS